MSLFDSGRLDSFSWYSLHLLSLLLLLLSIIIYTITATNTRRNTSYWIKYWSEKQRRRSIFDQTHPLIYYVIYYYSRGNIGRRRRRIAYNYEWRRRRNIFAWTHPLIYYLIYYYSRGIIGRNRLRLRPKNNKKKNRVPLRPTNLLLLLQTITTTYTVAVNDLEGVIVLFAPYPNPAFSFLHHTLNSVYGVDLYETDFHFLFDDITTNQQTKLYKDAPQWLLDYMIDHIKVKSGASYRGNTAQVQALFENVLLSYRMKTNKIMHFKRGQDLAS